MTNDASPPFMEALRKLQAGRFSVAEELLRKAWEEHADPRARVLLVLLRYVKGDAEACDIAEVATEHNLLRDPHIAPLLAVLPGRQPETLSHLSHEESEEYWTEERLRDAIPMDESASNGAGEKPSSNTGGASTEIGAQ